MNRKITEIYQNNSKLIKYGIIGVISSSTDFVIYSALVMTNVNMLIANAIGVNIGIIISFILNRRYNFRVKDHIGQRFLSFYTVGLTGLALSSALLYAFVDMIGLNEISSKIFTIIIVALFQFILNNYITFKKTTT